MLRQTQKIAKPIANEIEKAENNRQDPKARHQSQNKQAAMKHKQQARPLNRPPVLVRLIFMEAVEPFIAGDISLTNPAERMQNGLPQSRNEPALTESSARLCHKIDGEKL